MNNKDLFEGLQALADTAFPKRCSSCGKEFECVEDYTKETQHVRGKAGFKESEDDSGEQILELYRNCTCGSTLMSFFQNRRDTSQRGLKRREAFGNIMSELVKRGVEPEKARSELLRYLKNRKNTFIDDLGIDLNIIN